MVLYLAGQRVALRTAQGLRFLHSDALGSTVMTSDPATYYASFGPMVAEDYDGAGGADGGARCPPLCHSFRALSLRTLVPKPFAQREQSCYTRPSGNRPKFTSNTPSDQRCRAQAAVARPEPAHRWMKRAGDKTKRETWLSSR